MKKYTHSHSHLDKHPVVARSGKQAEKLRRHGQVVFGVLVGELTNDVHRARHHLGEGTRTRTKTSLSERARRGFLNLQIKSLQSSPRSVHEHCAYRIAPHEGVHESIKHA